MEKQAFESYVHTVRSKDAVHQTGEKIDELDGNRYGTESKLWMKIKERTNEKKKKKKTFGEFGVGFHEFELPNCVKEATHGERLKHEAESSFDSKSSYSHASLLSYFLFHKKKKKSIIKY